MNNRDDSVNDERVAISVADLEDSLTSAWRCLSEMAKYKPGFLDDHPELQELMYGEEMVNSKIDRMEEEGYE